MNALDYSFQTLHAAVLAAKRDASESDRIALPPILTALFAENERLLPTAEFPYKGQPDLSALDLLFQEALDLHHIQ